MAQGLKINRARRSVLKTVGILAAAFVGTTGAYKPAAAKHDDDDGSCFLRGTQMHTAKGYRAIETLATGDKVATRFAGFAPIKAIDVFTLDRVAGKWVGPSRPVRVKRNALGENTPARDLCLTASHAVFVDGFLMRIGQLVNGTSIVFETADGHDTLDFFHIELERHDVLDAQGAPCESRIDPFAESCVPMLSFGGRRGELRSRLRSALSLVVDRRQPLDIIRDTIEERGLQLAQAA